MKRETTLFDNFLNTNIKWQHRIISPNAFRAANKFVLDSGASTFVGEMTRNIGAELLAQHEFARPPFPITWIELNHMDYWRALARKEPDEFADEKWGVFIHNNAAHIITSSSDKHPALVLPIRFMLHTPIGFDDELKLAQASNMSRLILRRSIIGSYGVDPNKHDDLITEVVYSHKMEIMSDWLTREGGRAGSREWHLLMRASSGDLKLILVLLLFLTRPGRQVIVKQDQPRRVGLARGKRAVFLEHSTVHMRLNVREPITKVLNGLGSGVSPRRHPVRGHWCQSRKVGKGCEHLWVAKDEDHYECGRGCGARRWWRDDCFRGSFNEGFVSREGYEVHK